MELHNTKNQKQEETVVKPEIAKSVSVKTEVLSQLNEADRVALDNLLEKDDRFRDIFEVQKVGKDLLRPQDVILPKEVADQFSKQGAEALKVIISAYGAYLSPFVTVEETEPFSSLLEYMTSSEHNWDMVVSFDKKGYINAGYCGRQLPVDYKGETVRAAWIEHTWSHKDVRYQGLGSKMYELFEKNCDKDTKPQVVFIEIDNPRALESDERFHDMKNVKARTEAWIESGQTMDPYHRNDFWGKQSFRVIAMKTPDGTLAAAPYIQISMDPPNMEEGGYCDTMFAGIKVRDEKLLTGRDAQGNSTIDPELYKVLYPAIQGTIDPQLDLYPEYARTVAEVNKVNSLVLLDPRKEEGRQALARLAESLDAHESAKKDIAYCEKLLKGSLDEEQRELAGYNLERAKLILAESEPKQHEQRVRQSPAIETVSLKEMIKASPVRAIEVLNAYYDKYSDSEFSGLPKAQIESKDNLLRYLLKQRTVKELCTSGSLDLHVATVKDESSPLGFQVVGGAQTVDHESSKYGKLAKHIEQTWGLNRDEIVAGIISQAKQAGYQFVIEEAGNSRVLEIKENCDPRNTFLPRYVYVQPSLTDDPNQFVAGDLKHVYYRLDETAQVTKLDAIIAYYKDWTSENDPAVAKMEAPLRAVNDVALYPLTQEGIKDRVTGIRTMETLAYQLHLKREQERK